MLRRALLPILACAVLALAACGDDEETAGAGGSGGAETTAPTQAGTSPAKPASGCRKVDEPKAKDAKVAKPKDRLDPAKTWTVEVKTSCGTLEIRLDAKGNPKTAASFAHLAREGF